MSLTELQPEWNDPPERTAPQGVRSVREDHAMIAKALQDNPGRWARVALADTSASAAGLARTIRQGRSAFVPAAHFDAVIRRQDDTTWGVWARYLGESGEYLDGLRSQTREKVLEMCDELGYKAKSKSDGIEFLLSRSQWNQSQ